MFPLPIQGRPKSPRAICCLVVFLDVAAGLHIVFLFLLSFLVCVALKEAFPESR